MWLRRVASRIERVDLDGDQVADVQRAGRARSDGRGEGRARVARRPRTPIATGCVFNPALVRHLAARFDVEGVCASTATQPHAVLQLLDRCLRSSNSARTGTPWMRVTV